jgi:hypothetical protein
MLGHVGEVNNEAATIAPYLVYIPLNFFFCRHIGCALPVLAIQGAAVELRFKFRKAEELVQTFDAANTVIIPPLANVAVFASYIYLSDAERKVFLRKPLKYLIEQTQFDGISELGGSHGNAITLSFNNAVKELIFVAQREEALRTTFNINADGVPTYNDWFNYSSSATFDKQRNMINTILLQVNGQDVLSSRTAQYFNYFVPYRFHTNFPKLGVFCMSFALKPEEYQPSGTINFSRFDSVVLRMEFNEIAIAPLYVKVYAIGYNGLEVRNGQACISFIQ